MIATEAVAKRLIQGRGKALETAFLRASKTAASIIFAAKTKVPATGECVFRMDHQVTLQDGFDTMDKLTDKADANTAGPVCARRLA
jgi:hypothetical protein